MKHNKICRRAPVFATGAPALLLALALAQPAAARDTDVYNETHGQNAYILLDASGSMLAPVYEHSVDYGKLYDWYKSLSGVELKQLLAEAANDQDPSRTKAQEFANECADGTCYVVDSKSENSGLPGGKGQAGYMGRHFDKDRIYLIDRANAVRITRNKQRDSKHSLYSYGSQVPDVTEHPDDFSDMADDWMYASDYTNMWNQLNPDKVSKNPNTKESGINVLDTFTFLRDGKLVAANTLPEYSGEPAPRLTEGDVDVVVGPTTNDKVMLKDIVLVDGTPMPFSQMTPLHKYQKLEASRKPGEIPRGAPQLDSGLAGALTSPGYYGIGFNKSNYRPPLSKVTMNSNGVSNVKTWFAVTGNFLNYLQHFNLELWNRQGRLSSENNSGQASYRSISYYPPGTYKAAWLASVLPYPISDKEWPALDYSLSYPGGGMYYEATAKEERTARAIEVPGADKMQLHFAWLDLGEGDELKVYEGEGENARLLRTYTSVDNFAEDDKQDSEKWSQTFAAELVVLKLKGDGDGSVGKGYSIDRIRSTEREKHHVLKDRHTVAKEALDTVLSMDRFKDVNWGYAEYQAGQGIKATARKRLAINPNANVEAQREQTLERLWNMAPSGGTPTMMALQHLWYWGFYLNRDNLKDEQCNASVIITVTDGFPETDTDPCKFQKYGLPFPVSPADAAESAAVGCFADWDGDRLTSKSPITQSNPYDDIAQWMYEHSWEDGQPTDEPTRRVTVHNIAFGARMTLLKNASGQTPGSVYANAGNKSQLIAALTAMAPGGGGAVSFAAPSVSADAGNRLVSGSEMYTPSFTPRPNDFWMGNVKKYKWGDGSAARPDENAIYGKSDTQLSRPPEYKFTGGMDYWGSDWTPSAVNAEGNALQDDGAGEKMLRALGGGDGKGGYFGAKTYYKRPIYTVKLDANGAPETVEKTRADGTRYTEFVMVKFDREIPPSWLGLGEDDDPAAQTERNKLVNFVHGYEYDADASGNPTAVRDWPLGAIIHSQPTVVDYHHEENGVVDTTRVDRRYVVAGSNDGMLHVFSDSVGDSPRASDGEEVFAFIPADMLPKLRNLTRYDQVFDGVDGGITVVLGEMDENDNGDEAKLERIEKRRMAPTFLIFGERRGGGNYWCLDIDSKTPVADDGTVKWTARWRFQHEEIGQTWSNVVTARLLVGVEPATGEREYRRVAVFSGGYDEIEDNFPEPFNQTDGVGTPLKEDGTVDPALWSTAFVYTEDSQGNRVKKRDADGKPICSGPQDLNGNCEYDIYNAKGDNYGRGIWVVDLEDPTGVWPKNEARWPKFTYKEGDEVKTASYPVLPFSVTWGPKGASDEEEAAQRRGNAQTRNDMIYSFPATPSVMTDTDSFASGDGRRHVLGVMRALYVPDIYANLWKVRLNYKVEKGCDGTWKMVGLGHGRKGVIGASTCAETEDPQGAGWKVNQLFNTRHTVNSLTTTCRAGEDCALDESEEPATEWNDDDTVKTAPKRDFDRGQKAFNGPSISWGGTTTYFVPGNFNYSDPEHGRFNFRGRNQIATLFYGTGDAEHPTYAITHNRIYSIYDDSAITADEVIPEPEDDGRDATPTPVPLPSDAGDYTLPVTDDGAVVEISLTDDFQGTLTVPANVKRLIINLNGHEIEGADGDAAGPDGRPAIRLVNPGTILVLNGPGEIEGGDGADETASNAAGRGGDAIEGADGGTRIVATGGVDVRGGDGGEGPDGNPLADGGSICGLDGSGGQICVLLPEDPAPPVQEERWFTRAGSLYKENNLMNLTCGEMDKETRINRCYLQNTYLAQQGVTCGTDADDINQTMKDALDELLTDDATSGHPDYKDQLEGICTWKTDENGVEREVCVPPEDDFKGWYRVLDRQGDHNYCSHVTWYRNKGGKLEEVTQADDVVDNHKGEAITTPTTLLAGVLYFTSYQPTRGEDDACKGGGNGRLYAMNYGSAGSVFTTREYDKENYGDVEGVSKFWGGITGIPTGLSVRYLKNGMVQVLGAMGDMTVGASPQSKTGLNPFTLNQPVKLIYWKDSNSRRQASLYEAEGSDASSNSDPNPQP